MVMRMIKGKDKSISEEVVPAVQRVTLCSIVINLLLSLLKFTVGIFGSSQAIVADAIHSLSDTTTDLAVFFGVRFWTAPADKRHPYGHWRIETIITATIGVMLATVAIGIFYKAVTTIHTRPDVPPRLIALIGAIASIIVKELLYHWTIKVGKETNSTALVANAWHHRSDAISSVPVAIAIIVARINPALAIADQIGAMIVSLFVLYAAWNILKGAFGELLDRDAGDSIRDKISRVVMSVAGVEDVHAIRTRRMGPGLYLDLHLLVNGELTVRQGHDISEVVRRELLDNGPNVLDAVVHLEPSEQV